MGPQASLVPFTYDRVRFRWLECFSNSNGRQARDRNHSSGTRML